MYGGILLPRSWYLFRLTDASGASHAGCLSTLIYLYICVYKNTQSSAASTRSLIYACSPHGNSRCVTTSPNFSYTQQWNRQDFWLLTCARFLLLRRNFTLGTFNLFKFCFFFFGFSLQLAFLFRSPASSVFKRISIIKTMTRTTFVQPKCGFLNATCFAYESTFYFHFIESFLLLFFLRTDDFMLYSGKIRYLELTVHLHKPRQKYRFTRDFYFLAHACKKLVQKFGGNAPDADELCRSYYNCAPHCWEYLINYMDRLDVASLHDWRSIDSFYLAY